MNKHTPGPWEVSKLGNGLYILGDRRPGSAQVVATVGGSSQANLEANARLVAAAPELLAQLKALIKADVGGEAGPDYYRLVSEAVGLLARVEGKE
jgi:hypothetical protein